MVEGLVFDNPPIVLPSPEFWNPMVLSHSNSMGFSPDFQVNLSIFDPKARCRQR